MTEGPRLSRPSSISSLKPTNSGAPMLSAPHSAPPDWSRKLPFCGKVLLARSVPPWMRMLQTWHGMMIGAEMVSARAENRRFRLLSALRAYTKAPYKTDSHRKNGKC